MGKEILKSIHCSGLFVTPTDLGSEWNSHKGHSSLGCLFASIGQVGIGPVMVSSNSSYPNNETSNLPSSDMSLKFVSKTPISTPNTVTSLGATMAALEETQGKKEKHGGFKLRIKIKNPSLRRLVSGAIAGAMSRTAVAPLETIRTHLMLGSSGFTTAEVFQNIMKHEGWSGLFRGNWVNVIRVAPSRAIELFAYDTLNKQLSSKANIVSKLPIPPSLIAGAFAGVCSTLTTYPLELLKTRLTIQRGVYENLSHAFLKIFREEGPMALYKGLTPSLIGVVPYSAISYYAYETLRKAYKKLFKQEEIGNIATLLIGSAAGAFSSSATYPLEVARKHMQVGTLCGRQEYRNMLHAIMSILEQEGLSGLYRGVVPSCLKLVPAAGISFMCYEACKRILVEKGDDE